MSQPNLDRLFEPRSIAVVGASNRPRSVGAAVMRNLLQGGFGGAILPVNPKYEVVAGVHAYQSPSQLPAAPDSCGRLYVGLIIPEPQQNPYGKETDHADL